MKMMILLLVVVLMLLVTPELATAINIKRKMVMMAEGTTKTSAAVTTEVQINKEKEKRSVVDSREQAQINNHHSIPRQAWDGNNQDQNNGPATDIQNKDSTLPSGNHG